MNKEDYQMFDNMFIESMDLQRDEYVDIPTCKTQDTQQGLLTNRVSGKSIRRSLLYDLVNISE